MTQSVVIDIIRQAIFTVILVAGGPIATGLIVGVTVSIFQAVTSIQEPTMAFAPKILAVMLSLVFFGYFMITILTDFVNSIYYNIPAFIANLR